MRISDWSSDVCSSDLRVGDFESASDLSGVNLALGRLRIDTSGHVDLVAERDVAAHRAVHHEAVRPVARAGSGRNDDGRPRRSEEHTFELQSLMRISYAVFCLTKKTQEQTKQANKHHRKTKSS